jgi:hypothetical protein
MVVALAHNVLHCRSGGGFAQLIQTTTNAQLFTTAENLFVCHHFGNAVVMGSGFVKRIFINKLKS